MVQSDATPRLLLQPSCTSTPAFMSQYRHNHQIALAAEWSVCNSLCLICDAFRVDQSSWLKYLQLQHCSASCYAQNSNALQETHSPKLKVISMIYC
jgi:hypothetical protein